MYKQHRTEIHKVQIPRIAKRNDQDTIIMEDIKAPTQTWPDGDKELK